MPSLLAARAHAQLTARRDRPRPAGEPIGVAPGPDPDRVLVVGSGPAGGAGAASQELALPGLLSRAVTGRTGRGAVVEVRGMPHARLADLPALLDGAHLGRFDVVVLVVGMADAAAGTGARRWVGALQRRLDALQADGARDAVVLLTRIPPMSAVVVAPGPAARLVDARIARMNRGLESLARTRPATAVMPLPVPDGAAPVGSPAWYRRCADALGDALAPLLGAQR